MDMALKLHMCAKPSQKEKKTSSAFIIWITPKVSECFDLNLFIHTILFTPNRLEYFTYTTAEGILAGETWTLAFKKTILLYHI